MDILILLADLALTVFVYCSPAVIYRFLIKKEPAEKIPARNFCIISSVIVYLVLLVIYLSAGFDIVPNVAAAAIWGFVSYRILLYEDKTKVKTDNPPANDTGTVPTQLSIFDAPETLTEKDEPHQEAQQEQPPDPLPPPEKLPLPDPIQESPQQIGNGPIIFACSVILFIFILLIVLFAIEYC